MKKFLLTLGLIASLAGCATQPVTPQQTSTIKTIGVISAVGDTMSYPNLGFTVFAMDITFGDTSSWKLDQFIEQDIATELSPTYKVASIDVDKSTLKIPYEPDKIILAGLPPDEALKKSIKAGAPDIDAYLVVTPILQQDLIGDTLVRFGGLGIYRRPSFGIQIYALVDLTLIDAHDFKVLGTTQLLINRGERTFAQIMNPYEVTKEVRAHRKVNPKLAQAKTWQDFTPEQLAQVQAEIKSLLKDTLGYSLTQIGLTPVK